MSDATWWPWLVLLLLGAGHGLNPGMGWLFAVALGLQEGRPGAVWRSLGPLAAGHAAAIALTLLAAAAIGVVLPSSLLAWAVGFLLIGLGVWRLWGARHPRFGGMRVTPRELATWSLLMATGHGAGLMVVPVVLAVGQDHHVAHHQTVVMVRQAGMVPDGAMAALGAVLVHTAGYLLLTGLLAVIVYHKLGLRLLRTAWVNLDLVWALALIVTGGMTLLLA